MRHDGQCIQPKHALRTAPGEAARSSGCQNCAASVWKKDIPGMTLQGRTLLRWSSERQRDGQRPRRRSRNQRRQLQASESGRAASVHSVHAADPGPSSLAVIAVKPPGCWEHDGLGRLCAFPGGSRDTKCTKEVDTGRNAGGERQRNAL